MAADSARLNWILSADPSGLKAGCKEAQNVLKELAGSSSQTVGRMDASGLDFKGLKKSVKSLKYMGKELGGPVKSMLGDMFGVATMGAQFGLAGAAVGAGVGLYGLMEARQEKIAASQAKALKGFSAAREAGVDPGTYRTLEAIAGDDSKFLAELAEGMKKLKDAGPLASESLKRFAQDVENFRVSIGAPEDDKKNQRKQLALAGHERLKHIETDFQKDEIIRKRLGLSKEEMNRRNNSGWSITPGLRIGNDWENEKFAEYEALMQGDQGKLSKDLKRQQESEKFLTPKQKLDKELKRINDLFVDKDTGKIAPDYQATAGKATATAITEYRAAMSGGLAMAGAAQEGSVEAYGTIASATMAERGDQQAADETDAILERGFDNLLQALRGLQPNWRTDGGPQ